MKKIILFVVLIMLVGCGGNNDTDNANDYPVCAGECIPECDTSGDGCCTSIEFKAHQNKGGEVEECLSVEYNE